MGSEGKVLVIEVEGGKLYYRSNYHVLRQYFGDSVRPAQNFQRFTDYTPEERSSHIQSAKTTFVRYTKAAYDCIGLAEGGITRHYIGYISSLADMLDWNRKEDLEILVEELIDGLNLYEELGISLEK